MNQPRSMLPLQEGHALLLDLHYVGTLSYSSKSSVLRDDEAI